MAGCPGCCKLKLSLDPLFPFCLLPPLVSYWAHSVPFLLYLASFFLSFSSSSSFWADVRLSASARLSTAMAKKTFSRISVQWGDVKEVADSSDHQCSWMQTIPLRYVNNKQLFWTWNILNSQLSSFLQIHNRLLGGLLCWTKLWQDTVSADEEDDKVDADQHAREGWSTICHDAIIHHRVPVLSC